jgi:hypothetical protein
MHPHVSPLVLVLVGMLTASATSAQEPVDLAMAARIRAEGLERSQALALYQTLLDDIGARLTASPGHLESAEWARDLFAGWASRTRASNPSSSGGVGPSRSCLSSSSLRATCH